MFEPSAPTPQPAPDGANPRPPRGAERRAYVRYPRRLDMLWQFLGIPQKELTSARVQDLSVSGVALVFDCAFEPDTVLLIRLPTATLGWNTHLVRIKHIKEVVPGQFLAGCAFIKPLTGAQLEALLVGPSRQI
jgi:hypothetical protein